MGRPPRHTTMHESHAPTDLPRVPSGRINRILLRTHRTSDARPITHSCHHAARQRNGIRATMVRLSPLSASSDALRTNNSNLRPYGGFSQIRAPGHSLGPSASVKNRTHRVVTESAAASTWNENSILSGSNISGGVCQRSKSFMTLFLPGSSSSRRDSHDTSRHRDSLEDASNARKEDYS